MVEIRFVAVRPAPGSESRRAQELRASVVRSHASRVAHIRAGHKKKETLQPDNDIADVRRGNSTTPEYARPTNTLSYPDQPVALPSSCLETTLGQGRRDPYGTYDGSKLPHKLQSALEDAYEAVWPTMLEAKGDELVMIKHAWRSGAVHSPCLFHSQVMGAAGVALAFCGNEVMAQYFSEKRLEHKMITNRLIRKELEMINDGVSEPTAELILAILNLVTSTGELNEWTGEEVHPKSPLAQAQPLGRVRINETHFRAVHALVRRIGGLLVLQSYGLAYIIEVIDIYIASEKGTRPVYSPLHSAQGLVASRKFVPDDYAVELSKVIGSGLDVLTSIDADLFDLYLNAREVTFALDQYHRGAEGRPSLLDLVDARNKTQHGLCSVFPPPESETKPKAALYEICRLAGLLYSDMVILPLPYNSGVKPRLSHHLRRILEAPCLETCWKSAEHGDLLVWVVFMGAIAATLTPDRGWYLRRLQKLIGWRQLDWHGFKKLMRNFLWWDFVFEVPAAKIWKTIQTSIAGWEEPISARPRLLGPLSLLQTGESADTAFEVP